MHMVVTDAGARVFDNTGKGATEADAKADVKVRNERAEALGIKTRYKTVDFVKAN